MAEKFTLEQGFGMAAQFTLTSGPAAAQLHAWNHSAHFLADAAFP